MRGGVTRVTNIPLCLFNWRAGYALYLHIQCFLLQWSTLCNFQPMETVSYNIDTQSFHARKVDYDGYESPDSGFAMSSV